MLVVLKRCTHVQNPERCPILCKNSVFTFDILINNSSIGIEEVCAYMVTAQ